MTRLKQQPIEKELFEGCESTTHVWQLPLQVDSEQSKYLASLLSADEKQRAQRFHFEKHRYRFIAAHGQLRLILSDYLNCSAQALKFIENEFGKPYLEHKPLFFNLSHSHELALLAVNARLDLGVDIEWKGREIDYLQIGQRFFSENEYKELASLPEHLQREGFFNCWTRKEAYIKAVGEGMRIPLGQFEVSLKPDDPVRLLSTAHNPQALKVWKLVAIDVASEYVAALAIHKQGGDYHLFNITGIFAKNDLQGGKS